MTWICENIKQNGEVCNNTILPNVKSFKLASSSTVSLRYGCLTTECKRCGQTTIYEILFNTELLK